MYATFKASVLGKVIGDALCVALVRLYLSDIYPGVPEFNILPQVESAYQLAGHPSTYLTWIANNENSPDQLPDQGDIMVFGPTPAEGYTNTFDNPYGHTGICAAATSSEYALLQQNAPDTGEAANVTNYPWKFRPCLGWYTIGTTPAPIPTAHTIYLPPTTGPWHLYKVGGPYNPAVPADVKGIIRPSEFGGLTYDIVQSRGGGVYTINSQDYGEGDLWTAGSDVVIK